MSNVLQCNELPGEPSFKSFYPLIISVGMKLLALHYARRLGVEFSFPEITHLPMDTCREFIQIPCRGWSHGGLFDLYYEGFSYEDPLCSYMGKGNSPALADVACAVWGATECSGSYKSNASDSIDCEDENDFEYSDALLDEFQDYASDIFFEQFVKKSSKISYPDNALGELVSDVMDGVSSLIACNEGSTDFQHRAAYAWLDLLNYVFTGNVEEDWEDNTIYYAVLSISSENAEYVRKECQNRNTIPFYKEAGDLIESCLSQICSVCAVEGGTGWYDTRTVRDGRSLSISIVYRQDCDFISPETSMAMYLLMQLVSAVEERIKMEEKENEVRKH